jgi:hypothetical protein
MKKHYLNNRFMVSLIFGVCVLSYLSLSSAGPVLHNHHDEKEHHHDCPVCQFLDVAAFFDMPEGEPVVQPLWHAEHKVYLDAQGFLFISYYQSFLGRASPGIPTI